MSEFKKIRESLGYSPKEIALKLHTPIRTVENWEQGRRNPPPAIFVLLGTIKKKPL